MAHPKRRHSHSRTHMRRAHDSLKTQSLSVCPNCREMKLPHRACPHCGYYRGRQVVEIKKEE
jgi:large subunit ribosomal protein L32